MDLSKLRELWAAALKKAEDIRSKVLATPEVPMTDEQRTGFDAALADADRLAGDITRMEDFERRQAAANETIERQRTNRPGAPAHVDVHDNAEDRPFSPGIQGFGEFLQCVRGASEAGADIDPRLRKRDLRSLQVRAAAGASESIASDGGFLVTTDIAPLLQKAAFDMAKVAPLANMIPLSGTANSIKIPYVNETSRADGSRWGGIQAYWQDEAEATTAKKPNFGKLELSLKKLMGLFYATDEVLQDASALGTIIQKGFTEEFAFKLDDACIRGTGTGTPLGILNAPCTVSVAKESSQAAATILYANVSKMRQRMLPSSFANAVWFCNIDCMPQIEQLAVLVKNVAGTENVGGWPAYQPQAVDGSNTGSASSGTVYGRLFGRPLVPIEQCETVGTVGDLILADMDWYVMITKGGIQAANSIHVKFLTDELTFRFILRTDGQPAIKSAITPYKGAGTLSPFITLASR